MNPVSVVAVITIAAQTPKLLRKESLLSNQRKDCSKKTELTLLGFVLSLSSEPETIIVKGNA